jgi:peptidyl-prolyl cis-trans isomerase B (cyclophilin B)
VDEIAASKTGGADKPAEPQIMKKVTAETFGVEYPQPEKA